VPGIRFVITNREAFNSARLGLELAAALLKLYPGKIQLSANEKLIGNRKTIQDLEAGCDPRLIAQGNQETVEEFLTRREKYLLYK
jgi:uncharacterized protein YbbC (DUF1343 family)